MDLVTPSSEYDAWNDKFNSKIVICSTIYKIGKLEGPASGSGG